MKRLLHALAVIALCSALAPLALAKDHEKWRDHDGDRDRDHQFHHRDHDGNRGWEHRRHEREEWREHHARDHRPQGWDRGRKRGWHDNDVPPGQAKNYPHHPPHQQPVVLTGNNNSRPAPPVLGGRGTNGQRTAPVLAGNRTTRNEH